VNQTVSDDANIHTLQLVLQYPSNSDTGTLMRETLSTNYSWAVVSSNTDQDSSHASCHSESLNHATPGNCSKVSVQTSL